jgi:hypothetical protein
MVSNEVKNSNEDEFEDMKKKFIRIEAEVKEIKDSIVDFQTEIMHIFKLFKINAQKKKAK